MKIQINGADAGIQLEAEKTVGEILCALDSWLSGSGHRLSGLAINGETIHIDSIEACFDRALDTIETLDISTSEIVALYAQSLLHILQDISAYEAAAFAEKSPFVEQWKQSPQALLLCEQNPGLFDWALKTFSGEGSNPQVLRLVIEELIRELQDPAAELRKTTPLVDEICARLEDLPLDIQTGKDAQAAETVRTFSGITEKVFRLFNVLKMRGFAVQDITVDNIPVSAYITDFGTALRELLAAYEQHDTVLVGDIAEYEMAPRLRALHTAMINGTTGSDL